MKHSVQSLKNWFSDNPDIAHILAGIFDYNGVLRGKIMPVSKLDSVLNTGLKMPLSIQVLDIFGDDIQDSPFVFESGDSDSTAFVTGRLPVRLPHLSEPTALLMMAFDTDISPHAVLTKQLAAQSDSHQLCCGVEMEFTLLASDNDGYAPSLKTGKAPIGGNILSALHLDDYEPLFAGISAFCQQDDIRIDTITSEAGAGQFEVTFQPKTDLAILAEDILVFKYMVKAMAKSLGIKASFMAKPLTGEAGNGMHVHASLLDSNTKQNLFDEEADEKGGAYLRYAVAGLLSSMQEASLIFAPQLNSYRRLVPSAHAPIQICWGYDNRTAAIRIPDGAAKARRLELRNAGADANPYLLLLMMNRYIRTGLADKIEAPEPMVGNAYEQDFDRLAGDMAQAINLMANSQSLMAILGHALHRAYLDTKRQDYQRFYEHVPLFEFETLSEQL